MNLRLIEKRFQNLNAQANLLDYRFNPNSAKIEGLKRLENPSSVCQTALSIEYEANLREVVTTYKDRATEATSAGDFTAVALNLESLEQLSAVQNAIVE